MERGKKTAFLYNISHRNGASCYIVASAQPPDGRSENGIYGFWRHCSCRYSYWNGGVAGLWNFGFGVFERVTKNKQRRSKKARHFIKFWRHMYTCWWSNARYDKSIFVSLRRYFTFDRLRINLGWGILVALGRCYEIQPC